MDRQKDGQIERWIERCINRSTDKYIQRWIDRQKDGQIDSWKD